MTVRGVLPMASEVRAPRDSTSPMCRLASLVERHPQGGSVMERRHVVRLVCSLPPSIAPCQWTRRAYTDICVLTINIYIYEPPSDLFAFVRYVRGYLPAVPLSSRPVVCSSTSLVVGSSCRLWSSAVCPAHNFLNSSSADERETIRHMMTLRLMKTYDF